MAKQQVPKKDDGGGSGPRSFLTSVANVASNTPVIAKVGIAIAVVLTIYFFFGR